MTKRLYISGVSGIVALAICGVMMSSCGTTAQTASQYDGIYYTRPEKTVSAADLAKSKEETDALAELTKTTMLDARDSTATAQTTASQAPKTLTLNLENAEVTTVYVDPFMGFGYSYAWAPYRYGWGIYSPAYYAGWYDPWFYGGRFYDPWVYDAYWYGGAYWAGWYDPWYGPWRDPWYYGNFWHHPHHYGFHDPFFDGPGYGHRGEPVHFGSRDNRSGGISTRYATSPSTRSSSAVRSSAPTRRATAGTGSISSVRRSSRPAVSRAVSASRSSVSRSSASRPASAVRTTSASRPSSSSVRNSGTVRTSVRNTTYSRPSSGSSYRNSYSGYDSNSSSRGSSSSYSGSRSNSNRSSYRSSDSGYRSSGSSFSGSRSSSGYSGSRSSSSSRSSRR